MENWRPIEGTDNYSVSDLGRVINLRFNRILKPRLNKSGYFVVDISYDGKFKTSYVHKLVADSFLQREDGSLTNVVHINFDKEDNRASNLRWVNSSESRAYAHRHNTKITTVKSKLDRGDTLLSSGTVVNPETLGSLWYQYKGKYYKVRTTSSTKKDKDTSMVLSKTRGILIIFIPEEKEEGKARKWRHFNIAADMLERRVGPPPSPAHNVGYKDFDPFNLNYSNLFWETRKENNDRYLKFNPIRRMLLKKWGSDFKHVSTPKGTVAKRLQQKQVVISPRKKNMILDLHSKGKSYQKIADRMKMSKSTVYKKIKEWESQK